MQKSNSKAIKVRIIGTGNIAKFVDALNNDQVKTGRISRSR